MSWYAASIILYTKFKDGIQNKYPVLENVVLIEADSIDEVFTKAAQFGHDDEGDSEGTYFYENRPATFVFAGIRKIIECVDSKNRPSSGTEITYSQLEVRNEKDLNKLIKGESVVLKYEE